MQATNVQVVDHGERRYIYFMAKNPHWPDESTLLGSHVTEDSAEQIHNILTDFLDFTEDAAHNFITSRFYKKGE